MHRVIKVGMIGLVAAAAMMAQRGPVRGPGRGVQIGRPSIRGGARTPVDRWNQMSPEERERALQNLPPERQKAIRRGVQHFNELPSEEQQLLRERYESFSHLPPEKQDLIRRQIRRLNEVAPDRRRVLTQEMQQLRKMPEEDRRSRLAADEFKASYSDDERQIIQDLSENFPTPKK